MLKETEETIVFFVTFSSLVAFQLGGLASSLATPMVLTNSQMQSQKFAMGGLWLGVWGQSHQLAEAIGGLEANLPAFEDFPIFLK